MLKAALTAAALGFAALTLPSAASAAPASAGALQVGSAGLPLEQVWHRPGHRPGGYYGRPVRCRMVTERRVRPSGRVVYVRREVCRRW